MLDFIKFINTNATNLTSTQKLNLLNDFCEAFDYRTTLENERGETIPNPVSKTEFANQKIVQFIVSMVHEIRNRKAVQAINYEKLEL